MCVCVCARVNVNEKSWQEKLLYASEKITNYEDKIYLEGVYVGKWKKKLEINKFKL